MNSSLLSRENKDQDKKLLNFCSRNGLASLQHGVPTFYHVNGKDVVEIDYILSNEKAKFLANTVRVESYRESNVSDHIPVYTILKIRTMNKTLKPVTVKLKPKWDKGDKNAYEDFVSRQLNSFNTPQTEYDFILSLRQLTATLKRAAYVSIPNHKTNKEIICGPKRIWNPESSEALKTYKETWWQWRQSGEPSDKDHPLVIRMKHSKRRLRKIQRQTEAKKTIEKVERIMSSEGSNKEFYRLVKDQRKTKDSALQFLCVKGKILESPDEICDGWATHFGSLATPAENIHFDNDVKKTYIENINHILNICSA